MYLRLLLSSTSTVVFGTEDAGNTGITNAGQVITVDPVAIGFNIDPIVDSVVAIYNT